MCDSVGMPQTVNPIVFSSDRERLAAIVEDRNRPQKHVQRATIILLSAERLTAVAVAARSPQRRKPTFGMAMATALCRRRCRGTAARQDTQARPRSAGPGDDRQNSGVALWQTAKSCNTLDGPYGGQSRRRQFERRAAPLGGPSPPAASHQNVQKSNDPAFAAKVEDIVGLYMNPPAHAVVVSIDEKSQIQALDRTQPGLPLKPGRCGTMTHDYKRHGTTTLFAALNVLDGTVVGRCMPRHTHQEFIKFLGAVERAVPAGKIIHAIADNYATHKNPKVREWLADHPRWVVHFTPTSAS